MQVTKRFASWGFGSPQAEYGRIQCCIFLIVYCFKNCFFQRRCPTQVHIAVHKNEMLLETTWEKKCYSVRDLLSFFNPFVFMTKIN